MLLAGRVFSAGDELGVEVAFGSVESWGEPAFEEWAQGDDAHLGGEAGRQAQAGGAQAGEQAGVGERGDREFGGRSGRWAAPDTFVEKIERLRARGDEHGGVGDASVGRDEAHVELVGLGGGRDGLGHEWVRLDHEGAAVGHREGGAGGLGAEQAGDGGGGKMLRREPDG